MGDPLTETGLPASLDTAAIARDRLTADTLRPICSPT